MEFDISIAGGFPFVNTINVNKYEKQVRKPLTLTGFAAA